MIIKQHLLKGGKETPQLETCNEDLPARRSQHVESKA